MRHHSSAPALVPVADPPAPPTGPAPTFLKFTPAVQRGARYAIAALDFDSRHELRAPDGSPIALHVTNEDLRAAAAWLRYVLSKAGA